MSTEGILTRRNTTAQVHATENQPQTQAQIVAQPAARTLTAAILTLTTLRPLRLALPRPHKARQHRRQHNQITK